VLLYWLQYVPLPASGEIGTIDHPMTGPIDLVIFQQSYYVILGWFIVVEVAAWVIPRWLSLRQSGVTGRSRLNRITLHLAVGTTAIQAFGLAMYLRSTGEVGAGIPLLWLISGAAAACAVFAFVNWVEQYGIGKGWSILVLVLCIDDIWAEFYFSMDQVSSPVMLVGSIALVLMLATVWFLQAGTSEGSKWLPMPTTGLVPLVSPCLLVTNFILGAAERLSTQERLYELTPGDLLIRVAVVLVFGVLCHHVYFADTAREHRAEIGRRSLIASLVFLVMITTAEHVLAARGIFVFVPTWIILIAIVYDLCREVRFRQEHGVLMTIESLNRVAELPRAMAALAAASVPATTLGRGHRSMLHFFAPYVPVDIAVPADCEAAARRSLTSEGDRPPVSVSLAEVELGKGQMGSVGRYGNSSS
jgi:hypothetical protein